MIHWIRGNRLGVGVASIVISYSSLLASHMQSPISTTGLALESTFTNTSFDHQSESLILSFWSTAFSVALLGLNVGIKNDNFNDASYN